MECGAGGSLSSWLLCNPPPVECFKKRFRNAAYTILILETMLNSGDKSAHSHRDVIPPYRRHHRHRWGIGASLPKAGEKRA
jgi:hypothetical protein